MKKIILLIIGLTIFTNADFSRENNTSIVTDNGTGLEWQDNILGSEVTWLNAVNQCEELILGGHNDWRLPNVNELLSLVSNTNIDLTKVFKHTVSHEYWSSTTYSVNTISGWFVNIYSGYQFNYQKINKLHFRCVRAGR